MSLQFVIDGYNITNHRLFPRSSRKTRGSASSLINLIKTNNLCGSLKNKVALVFDGYAPAPGLEQQESRFSVVFSRDSSADEEIKKMLEKATDRKNTVVVSDDREIVSFARHCGVKAMSVEEFIGLPKRLVAERQALKEDAKPGLNYSQTARINEELKKLWLK